MTQTLPIGTRVRMREGTGTVVELSLWTANKTDVGDRIVQMDNGQRLYFEAYAMTPLPGQTHCKRIDDDAPEPGEMILMIPATEVIESFTATGWDLIGVPATNAVDMMLGDYVMRFTRIS